MTVLDDAVREAEDEAKLPGLGLVARLLERIGGVANAGAVFGQPVERDGVTVIPVAKVRWGAGGGGGQGGEGGAEGSGSGGGGGLSASPAGYIEMSDGRARFVKTFIETDLWPLVLAVVPLVLAAGLSTWLVLRGLRALVR